jgi:hypothetical protein
VQGAVLALVVWQYDTNLSLIMHPHRRLCGTEEGLVALWPLNCEHGFSDIVGKPLGIYHVSL